MKLDDHMPLSHVAAVCIPPQPRVVSKKTQNVVFEVHHLHVGKHGGAPVQHLVHLIQVLNASLPLFVPVGPRTESCGEVHSETNQFASLAEVAARVQRPCLMGSFGIDEVL